MKRIYTLSDDWRDAYSDEIFEEDHRYIGTFIWRMIMKFQGDNIAYNSGGWGPHGSGFETPYETHTIETYLYTICRCSNDLFTVIEHYELMGRDEFVCEMKKMFSGLSIERSASQLGCADYIYSFPDNLFSSIKRVEHVQINREIKY